MLKKQITELCLDWEYGISIERLVAKYELPISYIEAILTGFYGPTKRAHNPAVGEIVC
jgi:hypothetical protein